MSNGPLTMLIGLDIISLGGREGGGLPVRVPFKERLVTRLQHGLFGATDINISHTMFLFFLPLRTLLKTRESFPFH